MNETWPEIKKRKMKERRGEAFDWLEFLVQDTAICVLIFVFFARILFVSGTSMLDTLYDRDLIVISNLFYTPRQGDVVVVRKESFAADPIVKRVIATEGQTVTIDFEEGVVSVDGVPLDEPYTYTPTNRRIDFEDETVVPEGCVFLMGDNRNGSTDSRDDRIGCVDTRLVLGRVLLILVPGPNPDGVHGRDWGRMGIVH